MNSSNEKVRNYFMNQCSVVQFFKGVEEFVKSKRSKPLRGEKVVKAHK